MSQRLASGAILLLTLLLVQPSAIRAQGMGKPVEGKDYELYEFDAGENYRVKVYGLFNDPYNPHRIYFLPDERLPARLYLRNAFDDPGWAYWFADRGWIAFTNDLPESNDSPPTQEDDLLRLTEYAVESVFRSTAATFPSVVYAQGLGAAFAIKLRSTSPENIPAAILADPWGVRDVTPRTDADVEDILQRKSKLADLLWVEWGLGPTPGKLYPDSDLGQEGFDELLYSYDRDAPPYWATVSTGLQSWMQVLNPMHMAEWPVLVIRGPHPTPQMDERRERVIAWLEENGAYVEFMDLGSEGPSGISNLPMAGRRADEVAAMLFEWCRNLPGNPKLPPRPSQP